MYQFNLFYENCLKTVFLCNKLAENYNMHIMLRCFNLLENREQLNLLDVNEYVDIENQTFEKQYITLLGCTNNTSFENKFWKKETYYAMCIFIRI